MAVYVLGLVLLLAMAGHSDAAYCICTSGGDSAFQKNIDYACGAGADCSAILQNGACFNPNTVRDHCNYAVNSYYQRKGQIQGSCDFQGTAIPSASVPNIASGCVYQSSPSGGGSTTPTTNPATPATPTTNPAPPATPTTNPTFGGTPTTNPTFGGTPNTSTGGSTTGMTPGTFTPGVGLGPSGTAFGSQDARAILSRRAATTFLLLSLAFTFLFTCPRI